MPSFGLFFKMNSTQIFITTDTQFTPDQLDPYYKAADVIFHDCETSIKPSTVHSRYDQLIHLEKSIKEKMWLYHYNGYPPNDAIANHFKGFVTRGQIFTF